MPAFGHKKPAAWGVLFVMRIVFLLFFSLAIAFDITLDSREEDFSGLWYVQYFTWWSLWASFLYLLFVVILSIVRYGNTTPTLLTRGDTWASRLITFLFCLAYSTEVLVTLTYWTLLYKPKEDDTSNDLLQDLVEHALPVTILSIDWCFNRIEHPVNMWLPFMVYALLYMA